MTPLSAVTALLIVLAFPLLVPCQTAAPAQPSPAPAAQAAIAQPATTTDPRSATPAVCSHVEDSDDCHSRYPAGCDAQGEYDATLAFLKNKTEFPAQIDGVLDRSGFLAKEQNLPPGLAPDNHNKFVDQLSALGEGHLFQTVGYLYAIKQEHKESCNCELDTPDSVDYHMYIGYDAARAKEITLRSPAKLSDEAQTVIVEMTPQYRERFHPEWQYDTLKELVGKQVKITGQLLADNEHYVHGQDCARGETATCFRATIWELHPVTGFQVCAAGNCTATTGDWSDVIVVPPTH